MKGKQRKISLPKNICHIAMCGVRDSSRRKLFGQTYMKLPVISVEFCLHEEGKLVS